MNVVVRKDPYAPFWVIVCAKPCGQDKCDLRGDHGGLDRLPPRAWGVCHLGSAVTEVGAIEYAKRLGYRVVQQ